MIPRVRFPRRVHTRDVVTPEVAEAVLARDHGCVAPRIDPMAGPCRDRWGVLVSPSDRRALELDHIHADGSTHGKRADSTIAELVVVCAFHHRGTGRSAGAAQWATANRDLLRRYIVRANRGGG